MPRCYRAMISTDWNECLAPCGPFDAIAFARPELEPSLKEVFRRYTGNKISLGEAAAAIDSMIPGRLTADRMDAYLEAAFRTYPGVAQLIRWADRNGVLFMINTTGMIGYFQRVFARGRLPGVPLLAAHPLIRYPAAPTDPDGVFELLEIADKAVHTEAAARRFSIPFRQVAVIGDSGGDGPHFAWAAANGAIRIGSMTKSSLADFCRRENISFSLRFGPSPAAGKGRDPDPEAAADFQDLIPFLEARLLR